jgi:hypothetical protein
MQSENVIALLNETLKFYANPANYGNDQIKNDGGHMARFAVEQVMKLEEATNKMEIAFDELQDQVNDKTPDEIQKIVNDLTNLK